MRLSERDVHSAAGDREPWFLYFALIKEDMNKTLNIFKNIIKEANAS